MVKLLSESAPAKINLFLRVIGRRLDGYHELDSIFVPVSLYDRIEMELRPASSAAVRFFCDLDGVPGDERNLAFRAACEFLNEFGLRAEVLIKLHKEIPAAAGLGGGSSDAGAVLRMMAELCRIKQPAPLLALATRLGADVPFFLAPAASRVRGIGEQLEPLGRIEIPFLLIAVPPIPVRTAAVFQDLAPENRSGPAPDRDVLDILQGRIDRHQLVNDLERVAVAKWPEIGELKRWLEALGARAAGMSGSGGSVFGIFNSREQVSAAGREIVHRAPRVRTFNVSAL
jgi:4-diphosphocytidyl-2-C-methyl-D-erythritol kinase